jgi:transcriptional regulator with PAS, ATPase and Fis domain
MTALYRQMRSVLSSDLPVLLLGETGVGKERLVSTLHRSAAGRNGPLVAINCAAIPADLLEAELFGIGKGVATGVDPRPGKFELARGGTLFLDEIGEMLPALQSKLLRVLQDRQVQPVGGAPRPVDVRIVAATNADLAQRMERGEFRRDLYYRLAAHELEVPPLRECRDDVPVLVEHFLRLYSHSAGVRLRGVTVKALRRLTAYPWPGNVRELQHEIRRVVDRCVDGGAVDAGKLSPGIVETAREGAEESDSLRPDSLLLEPRLRRLEIRMIREALRRSGGRQVQAARMLGISRNGLADKIKRLGIDVRELRPG